jgi:hypothetical protein
LGKCRFGNKCFKNHSPISEAQLKKLKQQRPRSPSPGSPKGGGKGKGRGKGGGAASGTPSPRPSYCRFFLQGKCKNGDGCPFAHLDQKGADELNRAKGVAKAKAKAKGKAKAQAQATRVPAATAAPLAAASGIAGSSGPVRMPAPQLAVAGPRGTTVIRRSRWSHSQSS